MKKVILIAAFLISFSTLTAQDKIDFDLKLLSGDEASFNDLSKDKVVLINFWALWCKPCRTEMKALDKLYSKYMDQGFEIIGINIDTPRSNAKVESFIKSLDISYNIGLDPNSELFNLFNGQVLPLNILYDKKHNVVYRHTGYLPGDEIELEKEIQKVLGETE